MALGAVALLIQRGSLLAGVAAVVVSVALVTGAIVLSRAQREPRGRGRRRLDRRRCTPRSPG